MTTPGPNEGSSDASKGSSGGLPQDLKSTLRLVKSSMPPPSANTQIGTGMGSSMAATVSVQNLADDPILQPAPRMRYQDRDVPALGGIPLMSKLGQGGMGAVYYGLHLRLEQEVAVKVLPASLSLERPELIERFYREAKLAAKVKSNHLVGVLDVNQEGALFYLVMEYVAGMSAAGVIKKSMKDNNRGVDEAVALDICIASTKGLAAAHMKGVVHRDIKPDNILVPKDETGKLDFSGSKLADLGLARGETQAGGEGLTMGGAAMGTPGYMAPEQTMDAKKAGKSADVFSMGVTLYALLAGKPPFSGETMMEIIFNSVQKPHPPLSEHRTDISAATIALIDRCLAKAPTGRFADATALLEALKVCRVGMGEPEELQRERIAQLAQLQNAPEVGHAIGHTFTPTPNSLTAGQPTMLQTPPDSRPPSSFNNPQPVGRRGFMGWAIAGAAVVVLGGGYAASVLLKKKAAAVVEPTEIGIDYGVEKQKWLEWAATEFNQTVEGKNIKINLMPKGSITGAKEIIAGDKNVHVWSPSSAIYKDAFVQDWKKKNKTDPILYEQNLVLTPMVFLVWETRHKLIVDKYKGLSFKTIGEALQLGKDGWKEIANKPEWREFRFGHANPITSNSGLVALAMMSYSFYDKDRGLAVADIESSAFRTWMRTFEERVTDVMPSAQAMVDRMSLQGPSSFDAIVCYENVAIKAIENAKGRGAGELHAIYPTLNMWNEHPFYVLNAEWSSDAQREAAKSFLTFLRSERIQAESLKFGFRPGNPDVPITGAESPFMKLKQYGVQTAIDTTCAPPSSDVVSALIRVWESNQKKH